MVHKTTNKLNLKQKCRIIKITKKKTLNSKCADLIIGCQDKIQKVSQKK